MASLTAAFGSLALSSRSSAPAELRCTSARAAPLRASQRCSVVVAAAADAAEAPVAPEAKAFLRSQKGSAFKARRVLDVIRGRDYEEALMILEFLPQKASEQIQGLVLSCASNAKNTHGMKKSTLFISEAFADQGPYMKRFQPRAQGRAYQILKPTCHICVKMRSHETSKRARPPLKLATH